MADKIGRIVPRLGGRSLKSTPDKPKAKAQKASPPETKSPHKLDGDSWQARNDAETIARAHAIKADPTRRAAAGKEAVKMADEKAAELRGLRSINRGAKK